MKAIFQAAQEVQNFCHSQGWDFCFIGGVALQRWARPRLTNDVDLTLLTGFGGEEVFIDTLLDQFQSRHEDPRNFALVSRVLLLKIGKIGIDISLGALPFEESAVRRSSDFAFLTDVNLKVCSAEDLIVFKAFADRLRDWADVESVISAQENLDWKYIFEQLSQLVELKEAPEILVKLENLRKQI